MTRKKPVKKRKVEVVFDSQKRKEFLTGFRKRKNERRSRAKAELEKNLKEEKKRIRLELKDGFKHMKKSFEPLRELTEEDKEINEYEDDEVQVNIVELGANDLAAQRNMLGQNVAANSEEEESDNNATSDDDEQNANCIPGMDFDVTKKLKRKNAKLDDDGVAESGDEEGAALGKKQKPSIDLSNVHSKKDIDRLMKTKTLKKMKKSKVFKMKERIDKKANQKRAKRDRNNSLKSVPKHLRKKLKTEKSRYRKGRLVNKKEMRRKRRDDD